MPAPSDLESLASCLRVSQKQELVTEATKTGWRRPGPELRDLEIRGLTARHGAYWRLSPLGYALAAYLMKADSCLS